MPSLLPHDLCHGQSSSRWLPAVHPLSPDSLQFSLRFRHRRAVGAGCAAVILGSDSLDSLWDRPSGFHADSEPSKIPGHTKAGEWPTLHATNSMNICRMDICHSSQLCTLPPSFHHQPHHNLSQVRCAQASEKNQQWTGINLHVAHPSSASCNCDWGHTAHPL